MPGVIDRLQEIGESISVLTGHHLFQRSDDTRPLTLVRCSLRGDQKNFPKGGAFTESQPITRFDDELDIVSFREQPSYSRRTQLLKDRRREYHCHPPAILEEAIREQDEVAKYILLLARVARVISEPLREHCSEVFLDVLLSCERRIHDDNINGPSVESFACPSTRNRALPHLAIRDLFLLKVLDGSLSPRHDLLERFDRSAGPKESRVIDSNTHLVG